MMYISSLTDTLSRCPHHLRLPAVDSQQGQLAVVAGARERRRPAWLVMIVNKLHMTIER